MLKPWVQCVLEEDQASLAACKVTGLVALWSPLEQVSIHFRGWCLTRMKLEKV